MIEDKVKTQTWRARLRGDRISQPSKDPLSRGRQGRDGNGKRLGRIQDGLCSWRNPREILKDGGNKREIGLAQREQRSWETSLKEKPRLKGYLSLEKETLGDSSAMDKNLCPEEKGKDSSRSRKNIIYFPQAREGSEGFQRSMARRQTSRITFWGSMEKDDQQGNRISREQVYSRLLGKGKGWRKSRNSLDGLAQEESVDKSQRWQELQDQRISMAQM